MHIDSLGSIPKGKLRDAVLAAMEDADRNSTPTTRTMSPEAFEAIDAAVGEEIRRDPGLMLDSIPAGEGARRIVARFNVMEEPASKARPRFMRKGDATYVYSTEKMTAAQRAIADGFVLAAPDHEPNDYKAYGVGAHFVCSTLRRRDIDNMVKLVLDALNGIAWADDNQVVEVTVEKSIIPEIGGQSHIMIYEAGEFADRRACGMCGGPTSKRGTPLCKSCYDSAPSSTRARWSRLSERERAEAALRASRARWSRRFNNPDQGTLL